MVKLDIKPLSVNKAWRGRRFKTDDYKAYEKAMMLLLPRVEIIPDGRLKLEIEYGFSSRSSDIDNPCKLFIDCLQKKYGFNDKMIYELRVKKTIVKKGKEFIEWNVKAME